MPVLALGSSEVPAACGSNVPQLLSALHSPEMIDSLIIAVDLGAGSGRVFLAGVAPGEFYLEEIRRFQYPASLSAGRLRWDIPRIFGEIKVGLRQAAERASSLRRPIRSLGIDSWAVDYGLIDARGELIENPVCYRDGRTQRAMEKVLARVSRETIFERTGIQFLVFNTLYQLYVHMEFGLPKTARRLLLIPDLLHFFLTGQAVAEYTNATTTQLVNARTGTWDWELIRRLRFPPGLFAKIVPAGTELGPLDPTLAEGLRLQGVRIVAPATHDTASAVAGAPLREGWAYISSGTWSLVGVERDGVLINASVERHNFTNEGGAFGTIRFLKNVMGLWILESCRKEWKERGLSVDYPHLLGEIEQRRDPAELIFPDDTRFFNPPSMLQAIEAHLAERGERVPGRPHQMAKLILDSLAFRYASVLRTIESLTGQTIRGVHIVGGGSHNDYLNQATATATGLPVLAGPVEATATGNVLVQAVAAKRFSSLAEAREHVAANLRPKGFAPHRSPLWEEAARRYAALEAQYEG